MSGHVPGLLPEVAHQATQAAGFAAVPEPAGGYPVRFESSPAPWMRVFPAVARPGSGGVDVYPPSESTYPPPAAWVQNVIAATRSMAFGVGLGPDELDAKV